MNAYLIFAIGLTAQLFFSARFIVQWIVSERAKKVLSPLLFWQLSMAGSVILCTYGWLRNDFAIIIGQLAVYYVYIWNLKSKGFWGKLSLFLRSFFYLLPVVAVIYFLIHWHETFTHLFTQDNIPAGLIIFGITGQFTFSLRFIYQWFYSRKAGESLLPITFWIISLTGSVMIITYAVIRNDPVLILGQATGFIVYARNIMIGVMNKKDSSIVL